MRKNIEATILTCFLDADYYEGEKEKLFNLDEEVFSCEAFKYIARQINRAMTSNMPLSLLSEKLNGMMDGTAYQMDYEFMLGRYPLPMTVVRRYYDDLVRTHRKDLIKGML